MTPALKAGIAALVVVLVTVLVGDRCHNNQVTQWQTKVAAAEARAEALDQQMLALRAEASMLSSVAANLADQAREAQPRIDARIDTVRVQTPPELRDHPAVVTRDSIIDDQQAQIGRWREAYNTQIEAAAKLQLALDVAIERGNTLAGALEARPGNRPWWLPRLTVGPSLGRGGLDPVRINLGWEIGL